jgi:uncharacterized damage-inducible protein DinB
MAKTESRILAEAFESVRNLTKFYLSKINPEDLDIEMTSGEVKFNSPLWIAAHLAWAQEFLMLEGLGGKVTGIEWLNEYGFGSKPDEIKSKKTFDEIMLTLDSVHEKAMNHVKSLTDSQLDEKNPIGANFGGKDTKRAVLIHAVRHEPMHAGQLSWFLKSRGIKLT